MAHLDLHPIPASSLVTEPERSLRELKKLREMAAKLRYWDEVAHWDKEIKKAEANGG